MTDVSVIIPARNEIFLKQTIENVLDNIRGNTEIIAICDGYWPDPPVNDHPRVTILHFTEPVGQRKATNIGAQVSRAGYIMKLDAHCAVDEGFDEKLVEDCEDDWTLIPSQGNLHAFDWVCCACGQRSYQGFRPGQCGVCGHHEHKMELVWKPREGRTTYSWRFDREMHFQYWRKHHKRPENRGMLLETMSCIGACFFMPRRRFFDLGAMDEKHGSWGQFGTEIACKAWLSGGKLMTTRNTWYAHMFRTGNFKEPGKSTFPYPLSDRQQEWARKYSQDLWLNDKWPLAKHKLSWLVDRFKPVPDWHEESNGTHR